MVGAVPKILPRSDVSGLRMDGTIPPVPLAGVAGALPVPAAESSGVVEAFSEVEPSDVTTPPGPNVIPPEVAFDEGALGLEEAAAVDASPVGDTITGGMTPPDPAAFGDFGAAVEPKDTTFVSDTTTVVTCGGVGIRGFRRLSTRFPVADNARLGVDERPNGSDRENEDELVSSVLSCLSVWSVDVELL